MLNWCFYDYDITSRWRSFVENHLLFSYKTLTCARQTVAQFLCHRWAFCN